MNYPAMTNREYRRHIDGDGEVMEQRYRDEVIDYDVLEGALVDLIDAALTDQGVTVKLSRLRQMVDAQRLFEPYRNATEFGDAIEAGVRLGCWPSLSTWIEQQAEADEARALDMRYGDRI